jgi:hypothetical protein
VSAVRETEDGFRLVDCSQCLIAGVCELPPVLNQATQAFLAVLDSHSVASMLLRRQELQNLFGRVGSERAAGPRLARRSGTAKSPETLRSARAAPLSANAR